MKNKNLDYKITLRFSSENSDIMMQIKTFLDKKYILLKATKIYNISNILEMYIKYKNAKNTMIWS